VSTMAGGPGRSLGIVSVRLANAFELEVRGAPQRLTAVAQRLVAYVCLQAHPMPRSALAGSLWPELSEDRALANLRSTLWRLQRLPHQVIESVGDMLRPAELVRVDVLELKRWVREQERTRWADVDDDRVEELIASVDLLPHWDEIWVVQERERFRQLRLHALEAIGARLASDGRHSRAIETMLAAIETEPLRESAQRALIEIHVAEGNLGEAVRTYRAYAAQLRDELALRPSPALQQVILGLGVSPMRARRSLRAWR
jgi:DNA-binding SARP family transcriptional activator